MKVITWNINNRVGAVSCQLRTLRERELDVVALQDVNRNAVPQYIDAFRRLGLAHALHTLESSLTPFQLACCCPAHAMRNEFVEELIVDP